MKAKVYVTLKSGVLDPQGEAIKGGLHSLQFDNIKEVRQGKYFEVEIDSDDKAEVEKILEEICEKLLANTVIENYRFEIV